MKKVKRTAEYTVFKREDGRYAVKDAKHKPVNGEKKVEILKAEGLLKQPERKPAEENTEETAGAEQAE